VRVAVAENLDRSPAELDRARGGTDFAGELGRPGAELGEVEPGELGRVRNRGPEREHPLEVRERLGEPEDGLRLACRFDRRGQRVGAATRRLPVRRELRRRCRSTARELFRQLRVQLLALAGEDRRVDRLRQQRVAKAEAAGRPLDDEHTVLHRPAQRLAYLPFRERRDRAEQWVRDVSSGGRCHAQKTLCPAVESRHALQQQHAQGARKLLARFAGGGEELLGEEGVALRTRDDLVRQPHRQKAVGTSGEQRLQLLVLERPEVEQDRRSRPSDAIRKAAHALRRRRLVGAVGGEEQNRPAVEIVREEDGEIERRGIRPMEVLEHEQHRCGGCSVGEQRERVLEDMQLRARPRFVDLRRLPEGTKGLEERLKRQLHADEIDRAPEQDFEPGGAGPSRELGRQPALADTCFAGDEHGRTADGSRCVDGTLELPELA
jgi:hypothetical protein